MHYTLLSYLAQRKTAPERQKWTAAVLITTAALWIHAHGHRQKGKSGCNTLARYANMNYYWRSKPFGLRRNPGAGSPEGLQHQPRPRKVEGPRLPVPPVGTVVPSPGAAFAGAVLVPCPPPRTRCPFGSVRALQSQLHHAAPRHSNKSSQQNLSFADRSALRSTKLKLLLTAADRGGSPVLLWLLCAVRREGTAQNARSCLSAGLPFGCCGKRKRLLPFGNSPFIFHQKGSPSLLHTSSNGSKPSNCFP